MATKESAMEFVKVLKQSLPNFKAFSDALKDFERGNIDSPTLVPTVAAILHGRIDLMRRFNEFVPENCKINIPNPSDEDRAVGMRNAEDFINKMQLCLQKDIYASFLDALCSFMKNRDLVLLDQQARFLLRDHPELYIEFSQYTANMWNYYSRLNLNANLNPEPVPNPVPVTDRETGTEGGNSKKRKEMGPTYEDKLYEADMLIHSLGSTLTAAERFLEETEEQEIFEIGDYYSAMNLRCIERIYGSHGPTMIDLLQKNPMKVTQVILPRLNDKFEEFREVRQDITRYFKRAKIDLDEIC